MDLTAWLLRLTPARPLVVAGPGGTGVRLAAERAIRERGWRPALTPAEANILLVAGDGLDTYVERVWHSMPAPRVRLVISAVAEIPRQLDMAVTELHDTARQRANAAPPPKPETHANHENHGGQTNHEHGNHDGHDAHGKHDEHSTLDEPNEHVEHDTQGAHSEHDGHDILGEHDAHGGHGGHNSQSAHENHGAHGAHGHHMGGMEMPGGVPMADRAEDRDGLMLDVLTVPLGPVLPLWPAGLIVHTRLQGDVVQQASVEFVGSPGGSFWSEGHRLVARRLDSSARLLALAGWADAAAVAQRLRDEALDGSPSDVLLRKLVRRVRRSRTLRWLLTGVGKIPDDPATPPSLAGDALARLHSWLDSALDPGRPDSPHETRWIVDNLPTLLAGAELATARLIVASLDPDVDLLTHHDTTPDPNPHDEAHHAEPATSDPHTHHGTHHPEPTTTDPHAAHHGTHHG